MENAGEEGAQPDSQTGPTSGPGHDAAHRHSPPPPGRAQTSAALVLRVMALFLCMAGMLIYAGSLMGLMWTWEGGEDPAALLRVVATMVTGLGLIGVSSLMGCFAILIGGRGERVETARQPRWMALMVLRDVLGAAGGGGSVFGAMVLVFEGARVPGIVTAGLGFGFIALAFVVQRVMTRGARGGSWPPGQDTR